MTDIDLRRDAALGALVEGLEIVALRMLGDRDAARDAAQETVARVLSVLNERGIPEGYSLESYAFGTLRHVVADTRRGHRRFTLLPAWLAGPDRSPLEDLVSRERERLVAAALRQLPAADRALLARCYVDGDEVAAIARASGEPPERIRKRKSRALARLRSLLGLSGHVSSRSDDSAS